MTTLSPRVPILWWRAFGLTRTPLLKRKFLTTLSAKSTLCIGELEPDFASKYVVLISQDEQVELEIGNQLQGDCTTTILRGMSFQGVKALPVFLARQDDLFHRPVVSQSYLAATASLTGSSQIPGNSDNGYTLRSPPELKGYTAKQHRRILYTEFGVPLHSPSILTDHKRFFRSMGQVTRGNSLFSSWMLLNGLKILQDSNICIVQATYIVTQVWVISLTATMETARSQISSTRGPTSSLKTQMTTLIRG